jgi:hypothetical protein
MQEVDFHLVMALMAMFSNEPKHNGRIIEVYLPCRGKEFLRTKRINEMSKQCLVNCNRQWVDAKGFG